MSPPPVKAQVSTDCDSLLCQSNIVHKLSFRVHAHVALHHRAYECFWPCRMLLFYPMCDLNGRHDPIYQTHSTLSPHARSSSFAPLLSSISSLSLSPPSPIAHPPSQRPKLNLACNLLRLSPTIHITFLVLAFYLPKLVPEIARHELSEEQLARLDCVGLGDADVSNHDFRDNEKAEGIVAAGFGDVYAKLLQASWIYCSTLLLRSLASLSRLTYHPVGSSLR